MPNDYDPASLFRRFPSPIDRRAMTEIYNCAIEGGGFYFVDHLVDPAVATVAPRSLLDEALRLLAFDAPKQTIML